MSGPSYTLTSLAGLGVAALAIGLLHVQLRDDVNPIHQTVSDYVGFGPGAVLLDVCAFAFALAAVAIIGGLESADGGEFRLVSLLLGAGVLGVLGMALFPTDPTGGDHSLAGELHRWSVGLSFLSVPGSGRALAQRISGPASRALLRLSTVGAGALAVHLISYGPVLFPGQSGLGGPIIIGATERLLIGIDLVLLAAMALSLPRAPTHIHAVDQP